MLISTKLSINLIFSIGKTINLEVIALKKTLIANMFSSSSEVQLITDIFDAADLKENRDLLNNDLNQIDF